MFRSLMLSLFAGCASAVIHADEAKPVVVTPMKFEIVAKVLVKDPQGKRVNTTATSKVWIKDADRTRGEIKINSNYRELNREIVTIVNGDNVHLLDTKEKKATRMTRTTASTLMRGSGYDLFDPVTSIPLGAQKLEMQGFKKTRTEKLGAVQCDRYEGRLDADELKAEAVVWLRSSDQFPMKLTLKGDGVSAEIQAQNIEMNPKLSDTLFEVPAGYQVQEMK